MALPQAVHSGVCSLVCMLDFHFEKVVGMVPLAFSCWTFAATGPVSAAIARLYGQRGDVLWIEKHTNSATRCTYIYICNMYIYISISDNLKHEGLRHEKVLGASRTSKSYLGQDMWQQTAKLVAATMSY